MSKLEKLIEKLCPNGVVYKKLCDISNLTAGDRIIKSMMSEEMKYPVYGGGIMPTGQYNDFNYEHSITISRAGSAGYVNWVEDKFWATDVCFVASQKNEKYDIKYIYYYVKNKQCDLQQKIYGGNLPKLNKDYLWNLPIAVPPLEVQNEIVHILDNFKSLSAELSAELKARKKQYDYYLKKLIDIDNEKIEKISIGELFEFKNGINKGKEFFGKGTPIINYVDVYKNNKLFSNTIKGKVESSKSDLERYECKKGDVFFTRTSETKEEVGIPSVLLEDIKDNVFSGFLLRARPITNKLLPEYCAYCFISPKIRNQIVNTSNFTTRATTTGTILSRIKIPVPPLDKQKEVAKILDKFYKLTNDIYEGIPAEIEAREKQYEYFRNKLLTFKELKIS